VGKVAFAKLFAAYVIVDIDGLFPGIAPQLLDELAGHTGPPEMGGEPVTATVRREMILHPVRVGFVETNPFGGPRYAGIDTVAVKSLSSSTNEKSL
jgi:hypothetical protein